MSIYFNLPISPFQCRVHIVFSDSTPFNKSRDFALWLWSSHNKVIAKGWAKEKLLQVLVNWWSQIPEDNLAHKATLLFLLPWTWPEKQQNWMEPGRGLQGFEELLWENTCFSVQGEGHCWEWRNWRSHTGGFNSLNECSCGACWSSFGNCFR